MLLALSFTIQEKMMDSGEAHILMMVLEGSPRAKGVLVSVWDFARMPPAEEGYMHLEGLPVVLLPLG